ncbi:MAG: CPBP family glutamic-type intramembrane protease [Erythrobacter sp.]
MSDMPTSPVSDPEIEATFGDGPGTDALAAPAPTMVEEWRRLGAFLRRPTLDVQTQDGSPLLVLARIFTLDMAIMVALVTIAGAVIALGIELPETALAGMEFTPGLIALVVFGAPVLEEVVFRSWLSGRPGQLLALLSLVVAFGLIGAFAGDGSLMALPFLAGGLLGAVASLVLLRDRPPLRWFAWAFPLLFWLSTLAFALVHLANFKEGGAVLLALVLPQFVLGALLGYVRVRIGLWAAIVLHSAHNATAITIAALATSAA